MPGGDGRIVDWTKDEYERDTEHERSTRLKTIMSPQGPRLYYLLHVDPPPRPPDTSHPLQPKVDTLVMGTLLHEYVLEGDVNWFVCDCRYGSKAWAEAVGDSGGKWALKDYQDAQLRGMREGVLRNRQARKLIESGGWSEQTFLFEREGILAKARCDFFSWDGTICDLKTTSTNTRHGFERQLREYRYDFSAAFYELARNSVPAMSGMRAPFYHLVVQKDWPHLSYVWPLDRSWLNVGHRDVDVAFRRLAECRLKVEDGVDPLEAWPDTQEIQQLQLVGAPDWYLAEAGFNPDVY